MSYFFHHDQLKRKELFPGISAAIVHSNKISLSHVYLDEGTVLPEHSHPHEQWTHVISGELEMTVGNETLIMTAGTSAFIPSDTPHSAMVLSRCIVLDIFNPPREDLK